ncbi:MAG: hypothetical protein M1482_06775 [Chloroflexi bacterium]|nr:hypothetical protein [Chloroflexota bacterium]
MREEVASAASEPGSTPAEEEPSWIRHLQSEEEAPASSEEEAPDWLEQLSALTPEAPTAAEVGQAAEEMPAAEPAVEEMPAAEVGQAAEEMPAAEVGQPAEEMPTAEPAAEEMPAAEVEPAAEEMPAAEVGPELAETTAHQAPPPVEGLTAPKLPLLEEVPPPDHVPSAEETLASDVELPTRIEEPAGPPVEPSAPVAAETVEAEKPPEPRVRDEAAVPQAETLEHAVELPDWLKQMRAAQPETAESLEAFLAEQTPPTEEHPAEQPVEGQPAASVEGTTASLREKEPAGETEQAPSELEDIPDWLRVPISTPAQGAIEGPSTAAERAPTETEPVPAIEPARPEEVPSWIAALKPAELLEPSTPADLPIEASGPLAGLRGILPLALAITEPHPPVRPSVPGDGQNGAHLFTSILAQPAAEAEEPVAPQVRGRWTIRPFIYILLLLAVIVPFFLPAGLAGAAVPIVNTPAAEFYDVIQRLPSDAVVLVAFDYDPSVAGEMDLQANAIVRDLVKRRIKVIALSTLETGPFLAQHILEQATSGNSNYVYGIDYVNAGYLPGHEAGLAQLAASGFPANGIDFVQSSPLKQLPLISNLDLSRVSLVVELAGSEEPLKMWMEQFQGRGHVPVVAGVSAAVEPRARAYRAANQLVGVLSGLNGAAQYEILSNRTGLALTSVNAQGAAQLVLAFIIILGNIAFLISRRATGQND